GGQALLECQPLGNHLVEVEAPHVHFVGPETRRRVGADPVERRAHARVASSRHARRRSPVARTYRVIAPTCPPGTGWTVTRGQMEDQPRSGRRSSSSTERRTTMWSGYGAGM